MNWTPLDTPTQTLIDVWKLGNPAQVMYSSYLRDISRVLVSHCKEGKFMIKYASSIHIDRDAMVPFESAPKVLLSFWHPITSEVDYGEL